MRKLLVPLTLSLTLWMAACAAQSESPAALPLPSATVEMAVSTTPTESPVPNTAATEISQPAPQATSRGDSLVASDPGVVQVGAGKPVLLEFFRFT